jgi:hypothetical protein
MLAAVSIAGLVCTQAALAAPYKARYDLVIESAAQRELSYGLIRIALPPAGTAKVELLNAPDARIVQDGLGNRQLELSMTRVPMRFRRGISLIAVLPEAPLASPTNQAGAEPMLASPERERYLSAEPLVESDAPGVIEQSLELQGAEVAATVGNVEGFVASLEPALASEPAPADGPAGGAGPEPGARGALAALDSGTASATERVLLTLALLRAASIPARAVAGFADDGDGVLSGDEMQLWIEYLKGTRWHAAGGAQHVPHSIVFRIFQSADEIAPGAVSNNFYQAAGLTMRSAR